jgi:hypothetical protein
VSQTRTNLPKPVTASVRLSADHEAERSPPSFDRRLAEALTALDGSDPIPVSDCDRMRPTSVATTARLQKLEASPDRDTSVKRPARTLRNGLNIAVISRTVDRNPPRQK